MGSQLTVGSQPTSTYVTMSCSKEDYRVPANNPYWPRDCDGECVRHLYRSMRVDSLDLNKVDHPVRGVDIEMDRGYVKKLVLQAISKGTRAQYPWLNCSTSFDTALYWKMKNEKRHRDNNWPFGRSNNGPPGFVQIPSCQQGPYLLH